MQKLAKPKYKDSPQRLLMQSRQKAQRRGADTRGDKQGSERPSPFFEVRAGAREGNQDIQALGNETRGRLRGGVRVLV